MDAMANVSEALGRCPADAYQHGAEMLEDLSGEDFDNMEEQDQSQPPGSGPYATLHTDGPQVSAGSTGHPENCMPCTFYCFTRRGCNRGLECRFCHLTHQSKLQQRREAWKKQQREKRKSIRERVAAEALARRHPSSIGGKGGPELNGRDREAAAGKALSDGSNGGGFGGGRGDAAGALGMAGAANMGAKTAVAAYGLPSGNGGGDVGQVMERRHGGNGKSRALAVKDTGSAGEAQMAVTTAFTYNPPRAIFTIGQEAEMLPQLVAVPVQFRLVAPLPQGLHLDPATGVIRGAPVTAMAQKATIVEVDLLGGRTVRAAVEIEVVDFTRGGFVIGHMSEFEPGKFMLLLYVPEEGSGSGNDERGSQPMLEAPGGIATKAGADWGRLGLRKNAPAADHKPFYPGDAMQQLPPGSAVAARARPVRQQAVQQHGPSAGSGPADRGMEMGGCRVAPQQQPQQDWW